MTKILYAFTQICKQDQHPLGNFEQKTSGSTPSTAMSVFRQTSSFFPNKYPPNSISAFCGCNGHAFHLDHPLDYRFFGERGLYDTD